MTVRTPWTNKVTPDVSKLRFTHQQIPRRLVYFMHWSSSETTFSSCLNAIPSTMRQKNIGLWLDSTVPFLFPSFTPGRQFWPAGCLLHLWGALIEFCRIRSEVLKCMESFTICIWATSEGRPRWPLCRYGRDFLPLAMARYWWVSRYEGYRQTCQNIMKCASRGTCRSGQSSNTLLELGKYPWEASGRSEIKALFPLRQILVLRCRVPSLDSHGRPSWNNHDSRVRQDKSRSCTTGYIW